MRTLGKRVYPKGNVGSNPTPSGAFVLTTKAISGTRKIPVEHYLSALIIVLMPLPPEFVFDFAFCSDAGDFIFSTRVLCARL